MKKWVIATMVAGSMAITGLAVAGPGRGGPKQDGPGQGGHRGLQALLQNEALARELGVTDAQLDAVRDALYANKTAGVKLHGDAELARIELHRLMEAESPDRDAVMKAIEKAGAAEIAIRKSEVGLKLKVREIVGTETLKKIRTQMREQAAQRGGERHGQRPGQGPRGQQRDGAGPVDQPGAQFNGDGIQPPEFAELDF
ncbi:MAG TPA: periplasmic heavy metal sensor [Kiritimatiellia bacterium]|jgi:Spy/CpxP family protein refolding chaperone